MVTFFKYRNEKKLKIFCFTQIGAHISCPLHSADFINNIEHIMAQRFHAKTEKDCREPDCKYSQLELWEVEKGSVFGSTSFE